MEFGPLSETDVNQLRALLQKNGRGDIVVRISQEHVDAAKEARLQMARDFPSEYRTFTGADNVLFVEIALRDLLIVRGLLEKMGHQVGSYEITTCDQKKWGDFVSSSFETVAKP
jgi:hypothetical protein